MKGSSKRSRCRSLLSVGILSATLTMLGPSIPAFAQNAQWICEDALFPVVVEARTTGASNVIEFRIDAGDFRLPPESKGLVSAAPETEVALGQIVRTVELAEYEQQTSVTLVARKGEMLVEAFTYYAADHACGADSVDRSEALINSGDLAKHVCGELSIRVAEESMGEGMHFYPSVGTEWTPVATLIVTIETLTGQWTKTDKEPPDGLCNY